MELNNISSGLHGSDLPLIPLKVSPRGREIPYPASDIYSEIAEENARVILVFEAFVNEDLLTNTAENPDVSRGKDGSSG